MTCRCWWTARPRARSPPWPATAGRWPRARSAGGADRGRSLAGGLAAEFQETPIGIARTAPAWGEQRGIEECAELTFRAIAEAKRSIYIEAQYLTAPSIGKRLAAVLSEPDGPEVVVIATCFSKGFLEQWVMGRNRDRLVRRLKRADRYGRLKVFCPMVPDGEKQKHLLVHAKLMIVDDTFLRVGSSNMNNRSIGLDTECDLGIEATDDSTRATIRDLRHRLLGEHLGVAATDVAAAEGPEGSPLNAIAELNGKGRGLCPMDEMPLQGRCCRCSRRRCWIPSGRSSRCGSCARSAKARCGGPTAARRSAPGGGRQRPGRTRRASSATASTSSPIRNGTRK